MSTQTTTAFEADLQLAVDLLDNCDCCSPCDFPFYFIVTITGGTYPFEWLGNTWTSSGQSLPVCGTGSQQSYRAGGTPTPTYGTSYYTFQLPQQNWSATGGGAMSFSSNQATFSYIDANIGINKTGTISPFDFFLAVSGFTFSTSYNKTTQTSNLTAYSPTAGALFSGAGGSGRLNSAFEGSLTTTAGRTISWVASPEFPWDYDNP